MDATEYHRRRRFAKTPFGEIAYVERGSGPVALFLHGYPLNGYQWRDIIERLSAVRRCIAIDLMSAGYTRPALDQDLSYPAQARMIAAFLDALNVEQVDLVGNDSGSAVSQIFAARHARRLRSLTLTNSVVHDQWPPPALVWLVDAARASTAISTTLALYFHRQRGLAITLALNGASAAGFTIGPLLVALSQNIGVGNAVPIAVVGALALTLPLIWFGIKPAGAEVAEDALVSEGADFRASGVERTWRFWSIALPFALALAAQVGLIVHLVSFLLPRLGADGAAWALSLTSVAAVTGRLALAGTIDRLHQRRAAAASFASQAVGLAVMVAFSSTPAALYGGCLLFGLSVGNVITFPALIVQRECPPSLFGRVIGLSTAISQFTFALAPALLGVVRDSAGGYGVALCLCMTLQLAAALSVLCGTRDAG